jgi:membrane-bound ClpP family serine protease
MEPLLVWGLALLAVAILLLVVEVFVPSAGLIFITATVIAITGVVCLWRHDTTWGVGGMLSVMVLAPTIFYGGLMFWKNTDMGRRAMGVKTDEELEADRLKEEAEVRERLSIMGAVGTVVTDLRPIGVIEIEGTRYDALSESVIIPAGTKVKVTVVEPNQIKVRAVS